MNKRGMYSSAVALIAVVVIMALAFNSVSSVRVQQYRSHAKAVSTAKQEFENAGYLLGKSASDALADGTVLTGVGACNPDASRVGNYFSQTLASSPELDCSIVGAPAVALAPPNVTITVDLQCGRNFGGLSVDYERALTIRKRVIPFDDGANCFADVEDLDSLECEVDAVVGGGCGT